MTKKRTHNPKWQDTTRTERSRRRVQSLDKIAQRHGYETWRKLETAVLNGDIIVFRPQDDQGNQNEPND